MQRPHHAADHRQRTTDEVHRVGQIKRRVSLEHILADIAGLALPPLGWTLQDVHDLQVEPLLQGLELLAERDAVPSRVAVEKCERLRVAAVCERSQHRHHRRRTNAAGDEDVALPGVVLHIEGAIRAIDVDAIPRLERADLVGPVAQLTDRESNPRGIALRGRIGERVLYKGEGRPARRDPRHLSGAEVVSLVAVGLQHQRPGLTTFRGHLDDPERLAQQPQRLDDADVEDHPAADDAVRDPQPALQRR